MKCPKLSLLQTKWTSVRESWVIAARDIGLEGSATCQTKGLCASRNLLSQRRYSTDTAPKRPLCVIGREALERKNKARGTFYYFYSPYSSSVIKSKMAVTAIRTHTTSFRPPKIRLHCRLADASLDMRLKWPAD